MGPIHNSFQHQTAAQRYARGRPTIHFNVMERVRQTLDLGWPVQRALDVACGTGQSSIALSGLARSVIGTDLSLAMLAAAHKDRALSYIGAKAEQLPFADGAFDLATVALAFHWFERERFLSEARRVLQPNSWLVIYNNGFLGTMTENPAFAHWLRDSYITRYPSPPRRSEPFTEEGTAKSGFNFARREHYQSDVVFGLQELVAYLLTQSNLIAVIEEGNENIDGVRSWLNRALAPLSPPYMEHFSSAAQSGICNALLNNPLC